MESEIHYRQKISELKERGYSFYVSIPMPNEQYPDKTAWVKVTAVQLIYSSQRANRRELVDVTLHYGRNTSKSAHVVSFPVL